MFSIQSVDASKTRLAVWVPIVVSALVALAGGSAWMYARHDQYQANVVATERENLKLWCQLKRIQSELEETQNLSHDLQQHFLENPWGILESYVIKAKRLGEKPNVLMATKIDSLVRLNDDTVFRMRLYRLNALEKAFSQQAEAYIYHATNYSDRWRAVPRVVQSGGQLPYAVPFPQQLPNALDAEIQMRAKVSVSNHIAMKLWPLQEDTFPTASCQGA
jgi:hypothetical protein